MPDLMTHFAVAHLARRVREHGDFSVAPMNAALFYLGTLLPDLIAKPASILFSQSRAMWLTMPAHTPAGILLVCYMLAMLYPEEKRKSYMKCLMAGTALHLALDLLQKHVSQGTYYLFFPFTWLTWHIPLFWPSDSVLAILPLLILIAIIEYCRTTPNTYPV